VISSSVILALALVTTSSGNERQTVVCADTAFSRSVERRQIDEFLSLLEEEARFFSRGSIKDGTEEIRCAWSVYFQTGGPSLRWRPQFVAIVADDMLAITRGPYRYRRREADGDLIETWGTYNSFWRSLPNGEWKILYDSGGSPPPPGGPSDVERAILNAEPDCP